MTNPGLPATRDTAEPAALSAGEPLPDAARARGRRLAITGHATGMVFSQVFTQHLPTLALLSLGASEAIVGVQNGLGPLLLALQLPVLRLMGRLSKRRILMTGQCVGLLGALPLIAFGPLASVGGAASVAIAMLCFGLVSAAQVAANTAWFPLLRAYVEPDATGRFFGFLRTGWHLTLIVYYFAAMWWLTDHPGDFGPLFLVGWLFGAARLLFISRMPERSERTGEAISIRGALALVYRQPALRRYLLGVTGAGAVRLCVLPFAIVMMRREIGFSEAQVLYTTIALFGGGLISLIAWGAVVDRIGAEPVFRWTSIASCALTLVWLTASEPTSQTLAIIVATVFGLAVASSGFGVADTHVLFALTPPDAPARTLVVAQVTVSAVAGLAPVVVGLVLEALLAAAQGADERLAIYHGFFALAALLRLVVYWPLRQFRDGQTQHG